MVWNQDEAANILDHEDNTLDGFQFLLEAIGERFYNFIKRKMRPDSGVLTHVRATVYPGILKIVVEKLGIVAKRLIAIGREKSSPFHIGIRVMLILDLLVALNIIVYYGINGTINRISKATVKKTGLHESLLKYKFPLFRLSMLSIPDLELCVDAVEDHSKPLLIDSYPQKRFKANDHALIHDQFYLVQIGYVYDYYAQAYAFKEKVASFRSYITANINDLNRGRRILIKDAMKLFRSAYEWLIVNVAGRFVDKFRSELPIGFNDNLNTSENAILQLDETDPTQLLSLFPTLFEIVGVLQDGKLSPGGIKKHGKNIKASNDFEILFDRVCEWKLKEPESFKTLEVIKIFHYDVHKELEECFTDEVDKSQLRDMFRQKFEEVMSAQKCFPLIGKTAVIYHELLTLGCVSPVLLRNIRGEIPFTVMEAHGEMLDLPVDTRLLPHNTSYWFPQFNDYVIMPHIYVRF
jgi:hypothetical protein